MAKKKSNYKQHTIGELMQMLKQALQDNPYLDMNSPIMISDYNMSGFKYDFDLLPCFSPQQHTAGLCLFHSLGEVPVDKKNEEIYIEPSYDTDWDEPFIREEEPAEEDSSIMKFVKRMKA